MKHRLQKGQLQSGKHDRKTGAPCNAPLFLYLPENSPRSCRHKKQSVSLPGRVCTILICCLLCTALLLTGCSKKDRKTESSGKDSVRPSASSSDSDGQSGNSKAKESGKTSPGSSSDTKVEAVFFDVGKGDCILFTCGDSHVMIDAGYEETSDDILKELKKRDVESLDAMIITHYDKDHVGGAAEIASSIPVGMIYLPDYDGDPDKCGDLIDLINSEKLSHTRVASTEEFDADGVDFKVHPALVSYDPKIKNDNDASLIIEVFCGDDQWLLPGDIEEEAIAAWLETNQQEYDVLKYPHHGRKESNSSDFISNVSPKVTVITDSKDKHASKKVLNMMNESEVDVYRSSENGTITITGGGNEEFVVSTEK